MSAWGTGLYSDDTTCDVRDDYAKRLKTGSSSEEAARDILSRFGDLLADRQIECLVILALAETQWRYGMPVASVSERAQNLLADGADLSFWLADSPDDAPARQQVLARLAKKLASPPPAPKAIKVVTPNARPKRQHLTAPPGSVFLLPIGARFVPIVLLGFHELEKSIEPLFCAFPSWLDSTEQPILPAVFDQQPLQLQTGLGLTTVFGILSNDARKNPFKPLLATGMAPAKSLPIPPAMPTFIFLNGLLDMLAEACDTAPKG